MEPELISELVYPDIIIVEKMHKVWSETEEEGPSVRVKPINLEVKEYPEDQRKFQTSSAKFKSAR